MTIYPYDRRTYITQTILKSKETPGVASYNITKFDEKYCKPPKSGAVPINEDRYTHFDEINYVQKQLPSFYEAVPIVSQILK